MIVTGVQTFAISISGIEVDLRYAARDNVVGADIYFFFTSRRRHTNCSRNWSSDVCSSDLFNIKTRRVTMASLPPRCQGGRPCQGRPPWQRGGRDAMVTRRVLMLKCDRLSVVVFNLEKGTDRKSVVLGKGVDLGGRRFI